MPFAVKQDCQSDAPRTRAQNTYIHCYTSSDSRSLLNFLMFLNLLKSKSFKSFSDEAYKSQSLLNL
jgi:hypothetical protein